MERKTVASAVPSRRSSATTVTVVWKRASAVISRILRSPTMVKLAVSPTATESGRPSSAVGVKSTNSNWSSADWRMRERTARSRRSSGVSIVRTLMRSTPTCEAEALAKSTMMSPATWSVSPTTRVGSPRRISSIS